MNMSSASLACLSTLFYLLRLLIIVIPVSSLVTILYVFVEPLQSCQLFSNWQKYLFRNFVQWPLRCAKGIVNPHCQEEQPSQKPEVQSSAVVQNHHHRPPNQPDSEPTLTVVRVEPSIAERKSP